MTKLRSAAEINAKTDEELVRRAQAGEVEAFNLLYDRYLTAVFRRVSYSVPQADIEDVTQDVFIAMLRSLKDFRGESKFRTWLYTILGRKIADYYRRRDPVDFQWKEGEEDEEDDSPDLGVQISDGSSFSVVDDRMLVRQVLLQLPPRYREVILLRFADDLPFLEIANQLGQSLEATKSLFRRAISTLQQVLEKEHD